MLYYLILNYIILSSENKMVGSCKENGCGGNAAKDVGMKIVYGKKKRKTSLEVTG